jgi:hypothetical protein
MKFYRVIVNKTSKYGKGNWETYDNFTKEFTTLDEVKKYISDTYFYNKTKYPMYVDKKDGSQLKVGYIYAYKEKDLFSPYKTYFCQDWVEIQEVDEYFKRVFVA